MSKINVAKKVLSTFIAMAVMTSVFTGCNDSKSGKSGKSGNSSSSNVNSAREIKNYFLTKKLDGPGTMAYIDNMVYSGGSVYCKGFAESESGSVQLASIINLETGAVEDIDVSAIECEYICSLSLNNDNIYVAYYDKEYNMMFCVMDRKTSEIKNTCKLGENTNITSMFFDADGMLNVMLMSYKARKENVLTVKYDPETLEKKEEINVSENLDLSEGEILAMMLASGDGGYYGISVSIEEETYSLHKINSSMQIEYSVNDFSDMPGEMSGLFVAKNGNPCVVSYEYDQSGVCFVNELDQNDGAVLNRYEVETDAEYPMIYMTSKNDKYDFIFNSADGLKGYLLSEEKSEMIAAYGEALAPEFDECYSGFLSGNEMLLSAEVYGDSSGEVLYKLDTDCNIQETIPLNIEDGGYVSAFSCDDEGTVYSVATVYDESENEDGEYEYESKHIIYAVKDGENVKIGEIGDTSFGDSNVDDLVVSGDNIYVMICIYEEDGQKYVVLQLDKECNTISQIELGEEVEYCMGIINTSSDIYITYRDKEHSGAMMSKVDFKNSSMSSPLEIEIDDSALYNMLKGDDKYDFYYTGTDGYYGFNLVDNKSTEIINWVDSDVNLDMNSALLIDNDTILCSYYSNDEKDNYGVKFAKLTRADEETLKKVNSKKIITLAGENIAYSNIYDNIVEFNEKNEEYRIQINDYSKYGKYDSEKDEYFSGATKLNTDILEGDIPDIVLGSYDVDLSAYATKGMFVDLNTYFEKDGEIKREDYFEGVFDACSTKGKLYQLPTSFTINTLAGKASELGKEQGWTYDEFFELVENKGGENIFYKASTREIFDILVTGNLHEFVDLDSKTCDFSNGTFEKVLEFAKESGVEEEDGNDKMFDEESYREQMYRFKENKCLADQLHIYNFDTVSEFESVVVGEETTFKGYPTKEGVGGSIIEANSLIAISEKSQLKDAAWQFLRGLILEEEQDALFEEYMSAFPVRKASYEKALKKHQSEYAKGDNTSYTYDGEEVTLKAVDGELADSLVNMIDSSKLVLSDSRIIKIIDEQYDIFIEGGQSAKETADAVQSKVSLYLKEIG